MTNQYEEPTEENTDPNGGQQPQQRVKQRVNQSKDQSTSQRMTEDDPDLLTRRKRTAEQNEYYIPPECIPTGWSVEWKRFKIVGQDDNAHLMGLEMDGWRPADPKKFPKLVGHNYKGTTIDIKDLRLYVRPKRLTDEAHNEHKNRSREQVRDKMNELGLAKEGEAPRVDGRGRSTVNVKSSWERPDKPAVQE